MRLSHLALGCALFSVAPAAAQGTHKAEWPQVFSESGGDAIVRGTQVERGRSAKWLLADRRRLARALDSVQPQRKAVIDAYIVSVALDSDPVFGREAREAGKVLARRYDAAGRNLVLAAGTEDLPSGSMESLALALARVAEVMDKQQDVLVLYTTGHGARVGLAYHDGDAGYGLLAPARLAAILDELGIRRRVLMLSACYSGIFVQPLAGEDTALVTAASSDRPSFGCMAENDWTFFGDALINHALRKPQPLEAAIVEARDTISGWEMTAQLQPSNPQVAIGDGVARWLAPLEARMPRDASAPVGKPATAALNAGR